VRLQHLDDVAAGATAVIAGRIREGTRGGREFTMALSGGRTPWTILDNLARLDDLAWRQVQIYQVDERLAPAGDPDRNLTHVEAHLASQVPVVVHPLPVDDRDPEVAAEHYSRILPARFDLIHLGLGVDGHTASLIPGDPVLAVADHDVALTGEYQGRRRMTLTYPVLNKARGIIWIVTGSAKAAALQKLIDGDPSIPASAVARKNALVLTDLALDRKADHDDH
jgi:6-phosphogluconolactonase